MKSIISVVSILGIVCVLSGCSTKPESPEISDAVQDKKEKMAQTLEDNKDQKASTGETSGSETTVSEWAKELASGASIQCSYTMDAEGGHPIAVIIYADKGHYKTEMDISEGKSISLFDGVTLYTWMDGKKIGMKIEKSCAEEMKESLPNVSGELGDHPMPETYASSEELLEKAPNIVCSKLTDTVDFSVPKGIIFTDQCDMLKQIPQQVKNMQEISPVMPKEVKNMMPSEAQQQ